jgi:Tol biopolymer transport system component
MDAASQSQHKALFDRARHLTRVRRLAYLLGALLASAVVVVAVAGHSRARAQGPAPADPGLIRAAAATVARANGPPTAILEGNDGIYAPRAREAPRLLVPCGPDKCHVLEDFTWAPSGRLVALAVTSVRTVTGYEGIHVIDLATGRDRTIEKSVESVAGLAWSRDGTKLAYVAKDEMSGAKELRFIRADGSSYAKRVRVNPGSVPSSPTWSPDGRRIAFAAWHERHSNVYITNLARPGRFTGLPGVSAAPAWSPDGSRIAVRGCGGIRLFTPEGRDVTPLAGAHFLRVFPRPNWPCHSIGVRGRPTWSPDGTKIAITTGSRGVFVVPARGGPTRRLSGENVGGATGEARLVWRPRVG